MEKKPFRIEFPDEQEMKKEVHKIVEIGLKRKVTFSMYLKKMYQQIGLRYLFRDMTEIIFVLVLFLSVVAFFLVNASYHLSREPEKLYSYLFIVSPMLYFLISSIFFVNGKKRATFAVEMTCKYNVYQLAAFRMLIFSVFSMIVNALCIGILALLHEVDIIFALMISASSLFLFSALFLYVLLKVRTKTTLYTVTSAWVAGNVILIIYSSELYHYLLSHIPIYLYFFLVAGFFYIYINNLKKLITYKNTEGVI